MKSLSALGEQIQKNKNKFEKAQLAQAENVATEKEVIYGTQKQTIIETNEFIHKKKMTKTFSNLDSSDVLEKVCTGLASDIGVALSMVLDDLPTHKYFFKQKMKSLFMSMITTAASREETVIFFNKGIPGYSVLLFKKVAHDIVTNTEVEWDISSDIDSPEALATSAFIKEFFKKTGDRALTVETEDALFIFYPVKDLKNNLKEMGFYDF